ncbi:MAG: 3-dehydroquinate synthase, partial [Muribaculaceae bacterium]|nr:3-dehydroquinate synthase [Muribaculaceae bacterium]
TTFFRTLTSQELLAGYAEMIKHAFISSKEMTDRLLGYDVTAFETDSLLRLLQESVEVKCRFVSSDMLDKGARRSLNFGHTVAHAFESLAMERKSPLSHGYAVAFGMVAALVLSHLKLGFPSAELHRYAAYVAEHYGAFDISCDDYKRLLEFMHHDKKNATTAEINCTLLRDYGDVAVNTPVSDNDMTAALDIYRDLLHIA